MTSLNGHEAGTWRRVSKAEPCAICGHDSWCGVGERATHCMRTPSDRPAKNGDGWIHSLPDEYRRAAPRSAPPPRPNVDWAARARRAAAAITAEQVDTLADELGVDPLALRELGIGWRDGLYTFPMFAADGSVYGLRTRDPRTGKKKCVTGSRLGIVRRAKPDDGMLVVTEGESDCAAALTLGFDGAVGVPGAGQCIDVVVALARGRDVVIVRDNDPKGHEGAQKLLAAVKDVAKSVVIVAPPDGHKDLRVWKVAGEATREDVLAAIAAARESREQTSENGTSAKSRLVFLRPAQLAALTPTRQLIDGLVAEDSLTVMFGPYGSLKSFLAKAACVAIADGAPFLGRETRQGVALMLCGEGGHGIANRLRAATSVSRIADPTDPLNLNLAIACSMPPLATLAGFDDTVRAIESMTAMPALLVVDTWARAAAASELDENSTGECGRLVAALDRLRNRFPGLAIKTLHHSGNDRNDRGRGSSALPSAADTIIRVEPVRGANLQVRIEVVKQKDARRADPIIAQFAEVVVGEDERCRPVTSLRLSGWRPATERDVGSDPMAADLEAVRAELASGPKSAAALLKVMQCGRSTAYDRLRRWAAAGDINTDGNIYRSGGR